MNSFVKLYLLLIKSLLEIKCYIISFFLHKIIYYSIQHSVKNYRKFIIYNIVTKCLLQF